MRPQAELERFVRVDAAQVVRSRTLQGRGAWLCRDSAPCLALALRRNGFARSFRAPVTPAAIADLRSELAATAGHPPDDFVPGTPAARD